MREMYAPTKLRCTRCAKARRGCSLTGSGSKADPALDDEDLQIIDTPDVSTKKAHNPGEKRKVSEVSPTASHSLDPRPAKKPSHSSLSNIPDETHSTPDASNRPPSMGPPLTFPTSSNWASRSSQSETAPDRPDLFEDSYDPSVTGPPPSGTSSSYSFPNSSLSRAPSLQNLGPTLDILKLRKLLQEAREDLAIERRRRAQDAEVFEATLAEFNLVRGTPPGWKGKDRA